MSRAISFLWAGCFGVIKVAGSCVLLVEPPKEGREERKYARKKPRIMRLLTAANTITFVRLRLRLLWRISAELSRRGFLAGLPACVSTGGYKTSTDEISLSISLARG